MIKHFVFTAAFSLSKMNSSVEKTVKMPHVGWRCAVAIQGSSLEQLAPKRLLRPVKVTPLR